MKKLLVVLGTVAVSIYLIEQIVGIGLLTYVIGNM